MKAPRRKLQPSGRQRVFQVEQMVTSPLAGPPPDLTQEQIDDFISELGTAALDDLTALYDQLRNDVLRCDPMALLASLASSHLFVKPGEDPEKHPMPVMQFHAELLQALILQNRREAFAESMPNVAAITQLLEIVSL